MKNNKNLTFTFRCSHCNENNIFNFHDCDDKKKEETELFKNFSLEKLKRIHLITIIATITILAIIFAFVYFSSDFIILFTKNFGFYFSLLIALVLGGILSILFAIAMFYEKQVRIAIKKEKDKKKGIKNV